MKRYRITVRFAPLDDGITYTAIGQRDALINAAYDHGAMGVTILEIEKCTSTTVVARSPRQGSFSRTTHNKEHTKE